MRDQKTIDTMAIADVAKIVADAIGYNRTALITNVTDAQTIFAWEQGREVPSIDAQAQLRVALRVISILESKGAASTAHLWFGGKNARFDSKAPALVLRESIHDETMMQRLVGAAIAYMTDAY